MVQKIMMALIAFSWVFVQPSVSAAAATSADVKSEEMSATVARNAAIREALRSIKTGDIKVDFGSDSQGEFVVVRVPSIAGLKGCTLKSAGKENFFDFVQENKSPGPHFLSGRPRKADAILGQFEMWLARRKTGDIGRCGLFAYDSDNNFMGHVVIGGGSNPVTLEMAAIMLPDLQAQGYGIIGAYVALRHFLPAVMKIGPRAFGGTLPQFVMATANVLNESTDHILRAEGFERDAKPHVKFFPVWKTEPTLPPATDPLPIEITETERDEVLRRLSAAKIDGEVEFVRVERYNYTLRIA